MITSQIGVTEGETFNVNNCFLTVNQAMIFMRRIIPKNIQQIKATIVIVHGFGEHSGLFLNVAQHFIQNKFEVLMVDLKGFGYSGSGREATSIPDMEECVLAVIQEADILKPLILFGHSMGGLVCTNLVIDYPNLNISALIVEAPFLGMPIGRQLPWHKKLLIKSANIGLQSSILNSMISLTSICKNPHHILRLIKDSLVFPFLNLPLVRSMLLSIEKAHKYAHLIELPYLILHGLKDQITPIKDSIQIISNISSKHKKLVKFEDGYHELHHDQEQQQMYRQIHSWLSEISHEFQPLGIIDKSKRSFDQNKIKKKWKKALIITYFLLVLRLLFNPQFKNSGLIGKILSPITFVISLIARQ